MENDIYTTEILMTDDFVVCHSKIGILSKKSHEELVQMAKDYSTHKGYNEGMELYIEVSVLEIL